jgi:hypothetical protein
MPTLPTGRRSTLTFSLIAMVCWSDVIGLLQEIPKALVGGLNVARGLPWDGAMVSAATALAAFVVPTLIAALRIAAIRLWRIFVRLTASAKPPRARSLFRFPVVARRRSRRAWVKAVAAWKSQPAPPDFSHLRPPIEDLMRRLDALVAERMAAIKACAIPETESAQRARYLSVFRIEDAKLTNVGPARCAILRSVVRFSAAGHLEMAWHLYVWGSEVEVLAPERLRAMVDGYRRSDFPSLP